MIASTMDASKMLDENNWCVTIFSRDKTHAQLFFEGVKDGRTFSMRAHFTGERGYRSSAVDMRHTGHGQVIVDDFSHRSLIYASKSETWVRTRDKINYIIKECLRDEECPDLTPFHLLGPSSYLVADNYAVVRIFKGIFFGSRMIAPDNCISWCKQKLQGADIKINDKALDLLVTATQYYLTST